MTNVSGPGTSIEYTAPSQASRSIRWIGAGSTRSRTGAGISAIRPSSSTTSSGTVTSSGSDMPSAS